jgi:glycogen debranching enzyme
MGSSSQAQLWNSLQRAKRQQIIQKFYNTADPQIARAFLGLVRAPAGFGVFASTGPLYRQAIFGRDSIVVADDLLGLYPDLAQEIIVMLARLQGQVVNNKNEEEPGKIHHEYRSKTLDKYAGNVDTDSQTVFKKLALAWGGNSEELRYYGSHDATPLYIRLVHRYCALHGTQILQQQVKTRDEGAARSIHDSVRAATQWIVAKIQASPWHLLEYKRLNPLGIYNQSWSDSNTAYLHVNGEVANGDGGIAAVELQGYAYDALLAAADLVAANDTEAAQWRAMAQTVQQQTLALLWMPDQRYFAMGIDRDKQGQTRQIATLGCNAGLLLASKLLSDLPKEQSAPYAQGVVNILTSDQFMTEAGPRLRARQHASLLPYADYHGSYVSWPKATSELIQGLRLHAFTNQAKDLEDRLLRSVLKAGEFYEFFLVNKDVKYHYRHESPDEPKFHDFGAANQPEPGQAWTASAVIRAVQGRSKALNP